MNLKWKKWSAVLLSIVLCAIFGAALTIYARPMEDISLDLSLISMKDAHIVDPESFDFKGWTVYTQEGDTVTELASDGMGGFTGLELGQTFYFSRVMAEELDSATLQIGTVNRMFSVWLDDSLIYTDCPELDNRIGYLQLPMREWDRNEPIIISLPDDYLGKTLTIAQSFPEYTETNSVMAYPTSVILYCGYAYESSLISESFRTAILAVAAFIVGLILLIAFVRNQDWGLMTLSLVAFLWMADQLIDASFFWEYFGTTNNSLVTISPLISIEALLIFLATRAGKHKKLLWGVIAALGLSVIVSASILLIYPSFAAANWVAPLLSRKLPYWISFAGLVTVLVLGTVFWRKENWFYHFFIPIALVGIAVYWAAIVLIVEPGIVGTQLLVTLQSGDINYIYYRTVPAVMAAALFTSVAEAAKNEISRHMEKRLLEEHQEMVLKSYENMRRQHEEVMMIRHDMVKHFRILQTISNEKQVKEYLDDLIGQNEKIRPVVHTGNEMLDIILTSKLGATRDDGIKIDIKRVNVPEILPLRDADLCSLLMNITDNAQNGAARSGAADPFIRLDIHVKNNYLAIICENSADIRKIGEDHKKETVPRHGLGLKIIQNIAERYEGLLDTEYGEGCYKVRVAIPLS